MVSCFLEHGADPNERRGSSGEISVWGQYLEGFGPQGTNGEGKGLMEIFLANGANSNECDKTGSAIWAGVVKELENLADFPFEARKEQRVLMALLFRYGADPNFPFRGRNELTIWQSHLEHIWSSRYDEGQAHLYQEHLAEIKMFLSAGADPDALVMADGMDGEPGQSERTADELIPEIFDEHHATELLEIVRQKRSDNIPSVFGNIRPRTRVLIGASGKLLYPTTGKEIYGNV